MLKTDIGRLRLVGILEGISFLLLLCVAMPLKYYADMPLLNKIVGQAHGILFIAYVVLGIQVSVLKKWSFMTTTWKVLVASFIPLGTFYVDFKILKPLEEKEN